MRILMLTMMFVLGFGGVLSDSKKLAIVANHRHQATFTTSKTIALTIHKECFSSQLLVIKDGVVEVSKTKGSAYY